ncbi:helix-turn-helix transcriptional regulator [Mycobacterium bourgelatii]|uniref:Transcriptional regulator n=1 Tax=Mycobacterium bourgelatii TaxID=1273442 RepID=A0A7I9YW68_MYCBU|nr:LuxR family transcriptional regulator [Mycobacterium bourgelatii]MCV6975266.1 LuxR family transcriptional regulator [Mycobacterium bourgelatii]GFG92852.1 transcriptional regulator [Mycobacterium bourgelatii]
MGETDPRADVPPVNWSEPGVSELPTGTVTLLLADIEGSTGLWQSCASEMTTAVARLDATLSRLVDAHHGVRPMEQGEGDSFVIAFDRASDAVACALALQRAPLAPIRLRVGIHSGEIQLRDDASYIGPTINRAARVRDLAHGGQTVLTAAVEQLVVDLLPPGAWLADLGSHHLRDIPRPERIFGLYHPDLPVDFPPLRSTSAATTTAFPILLTKFVGRTREIAELARLLHEHRLVTLTGAGGVGKTRLAVQLAGQESDVVGESVHYVDLAPINDPDLVAAAIAKVFGLQDQLDRSAIDSINARIGDRRLLIVLDNCEHLLEASAAVVVALLGNCPNVRVLATSREPLRIASEVNWQVPSLGLADEAVELFTDRARQVRPDFTVNDGNVSAVHEICRRLDGMPLAIELAAARMRAMSAADICDSLNDRFMLLTGGARSAVRRQQTLRASVDWSHSMLAAAEATLFRQLAVFAGGFDLDAVVAVCGDGVMQRYHVLDQLTLLVDKSLVQADNTAERTRYRMLETIRDYALEKLVEAGEADALRRRHRDYYTALAAGLEAPACNSFRRVVANVEADIDNLRAAFAYSRESGEPARALQMASSLLPLWEGRGQLREGLKWFDAIFDDEGVDLDAIEPALAVRALADKAVLDSLVAAFDTGKRAQRALTLARELDDPALLARSLTACGCVAGLDFESAAIYFAEASELARVTGDDWRLSQILSRQAYLAAMQGDPAAASALGTEGADLAEALDDWPKAHICRWAIGMAQMLRADLTGAIDTCRELFAACEASSDILAMMLSLITQGCALIFRGDVAAAQEVGRSAISAGAELDAVLERAATTVLAMVAVANGDAPAARELGMKIWELPGVHRGSVAVSAVAMCAHVEGDLARAQELADEAVATLAGWHKSWALCTRAYIAADLGDHDRSRRDAQQALSILADTQSRLCLPTILECLARAAINDGGHAEAARLLGAADAVSNRTGESRLPIYQAGYEAAVEACRNGLGLDEFQAAWADGAALSDEDVISHALRGRADRKRPATGWASLTPAELDVARLVSEGLSNKDIAERLFISPRTVQAHLTHMYTKLGYNSRVQLAQEAVRQNSSF